MRISLFHNFMYNYFHTKSRGLANCINVLFNDINLYNEKYSEVIFKILENIGIFLLSCFSILYINKFMLFILP